MEQKTINDRISFLIIEYTQCSQKEFAEKVGVSPSAISSLFSKRGNKPGLEMLQKIAVAYPEIRLDWLLIGQQPMFKLDEMNVGMEPFLPASPSEPYLVVQATTGADLAREVNGYLEKGYLLRGPMLLGSEIFEGGLRAVMLQNMVREKQLK